MKPATLQRLQRDATPAPLSFDALRAAGLEALRDLAGERWTDHNLHDPGITLLETCCYALTELAYRAEAPLPVLLGGAPSWASLGLHPPEEVLPCRAATAEDLRRWLLDRVRGLHDARVEPADSAWALWRLSLHIEPGADQQAVCAAARRAYAEQRMLGEDLDAAIELHVPQDTVLSVELALEGAREPAEVLAELLHRAQQHLAGWPGDAGASDAGPRLRQGERLLPRRQAPAALLLDGLLAALRRVEGVQELYGLALDPPATGRPLALCLPLQAEHLAGLRVSRRGTPLAVDTDAVLARFADLQQVAAREALPAPPAAVSPLPHALPPSPYVSLQQLLPPAYGLQGAADAAQSAGLRGYLALFDQLFADAQAQLQALPALWADPPPAADGALRSYWQHELTEAEAPGVPALRIAAAAAPAALQLASLDPALSRRHRALDAQLALHGQHYLQNTLRQFLPPGPATEAWLLDNKADFARQVSALNRDRGGARNPFAPDAPAVGLAQRLPLLLGLPASDLLLLDHVLLRPRGQAGAALRWPAEAFTLRASLLLAARGAWARDAAFHAFVDETLLRNAPAHVRVRSCWLDEAAWAAVLPAHERWLRALQDWSEAPDDATRASLLDAASAALIAGLPEALGAV